MSEGVSVCLWVCMCVDLSESKCVHVFAHCEKKSVCISSSLWGDFVIVCFNVHYLAFISVFYISKSVKKHIYKCVHAYVCVCFFQDANYWMLNNAAFCRMPLLPNNILISDSGFENVNAFNSVTPHSHQTGENSRTGEARTYAQIWTEAESDRLIPNHKHR